MTGRGGDEDNGGDGGDEENVRLETAMRVSCAASPSLVLPVPPVLPP